jgi:hypothetical protein
MDARSPSMPARVLLCQAESWLDDSQAECEVPLRYVYQLPSTAYPSQQCNGLPRRGSAADASYVARSSPQLSRRSCRRQLFMAGHEGSMGQCTSHRNMGSELRSILHREGDRSVFAVATRCCVCWPNGVGLHAKWRVSVECRAVVPIGWISFRLYGRAYVGASLCDQRFRKDKQKI